MKLDKEIDKPIDEPIEDVNYNGTVECEMDKNKKNLDIGITTNDIEHKKLENQDKENDRELYKFDEIKKLLYVCITVLGILIIADTVLNYLTSKNNMINFNSTGLNAGIEVLKALIFSVSGYLFSKKDS